MRSLRPAIAALVLAASLTGVTPPALADDDGVVREGEGPRRADLNSRERKPFRSDAWAKLSDWQNGPALAGTSTQGKPVLIVTWTDYLPTAKRAVQVASRASERFGKDGLIVVLVHSEQDWDQASRPKPVGENLLLVAHDAKSEFRKALSVDQDPDYYLIDRAGQLRFADITTDSVEHAAELLVKETAEEASGINARLAQQAQQIDLEARRSQALNQKADFTSIPNVDFEQPSEDEYSQARWPRLPKVQQGAADAEEAAALQPITFPEDGWYPRKPDTNGRAVLAYLWHPKQTRTFYDTMPLMDRLQRNHGRDLVCIGVLVVADSVGDTQLTAADKDPDKLRARMEEMARSRRLEHFLVVQSEGGPTVYDQATGGQGGGSIPVPAYVLLSSDGKARWWSSQDAVMSYEAALLAILENDPGIQARRAAEDQWLKAQGKPAKP